MIMMPYDWPWPSPQVTAHADFWHPIGQGNPEERAPGERGRGSAGGVLDGSTPPVLGPDGVYGDLFLPAGMQGEEGRATPAAEALAVDLATALLARAAASEDLRLKTEAVDALHQADPGRDGVQGLGARVRSVVAVLDGKAWLTARIFGVLQNARRDLLQITRYLTEDGLR